MMHYDKGTRDAEFLAGSVPDEVEFWLRKARNDRQRWVIRLFRPSLRQFLDGFIAGLEAYSKQPRRDVPAAPPRNGPLVSPGVEPERITPREAPAAPVAEPVVERVPPRAVEIPSPPPPVAPPAPAPSPSVVEVRRPAPPPEPEQPPVPHTPHTNYPPTAGYLDGDHAIGVFRLSSWSPRATTQEPAQAPANPPLVEPVPRRPPEILWTNAMEQARTVGVVDLSAYDTLEYLNELRDVFDRRESLRNGATGQEDPRAH